VRIIAKEYEDIMSEIRLRYEKGENSKDLAIIYKMSNSTLEKRRARDRMNGDPWIKGSRKSEKYEEFVEENIKAKQEIIDTINNSARTELEHVDTIDERRRELEKGELAYGQVPEINKDTEKGINTRIENIFKKLELKRNIENIYTPQEEALMEKVKIETELKRIEAQNKAEDLKLKQAQNEFYLKKR
jgi:hypothetical protein